MPKRLRSQRRGKGTPTYRVPSYKFRPSLKYKNVGGEVVDIVKDPVRNSPLAEIRYADKSRGYIVAIEGLKVGDTVEKLILSLKDINEGSQISSIETYPNSGPKLCRTSGSFATIVSKGRKGCVIQLPSKKTKKLHPNCRAMMGIPAGEGRREKPFIKAGARFYAARAKGKLYPRTSGVAMTATDHPYGASGSGKVRPPVSRHTPPGRKVGSISPRRAGKKKK
jgi:large subunit ribosomal protein L2